MSDMKNALWLLLIPLFVFTVSCKEEIEQMSTSCEDSSGSIGLATAQSTYLDDYIAVAYFLEDQNAPPETFKFCKEGIRW